MITKDTKDILRKNNITLKKSLGQNLLVDSAIINRIVDSAEIKETDLVIEIGPGTGSMTSELAVRAGKVVAIEIDRRLVNVLNDKFKDRPNIEIINMDAMNVNLDEVISRSKPAFNPKSVKVAANLPYYITTPLVMKLLEECALIDSLVLMVQKEVADRMASGPGTKDYGALSVAVQYYSRPEILFNVPPHCFVPQPGVESTVIKLTVYKVPPVQPADKNLFFKIVRASFGQRRKTLVNALNNSFSFKNGKDEIREILGNAGIEENRRGETLSLMQFLELADAFYKRSIT